jgi:hypothetical protein
MLLIVIVKLDVLVGYHPDLTMSPLSSREDVSGENPKIHLTENIGSYLSGSTMKRHAATLFFQPKVL